MRDVALTLLALGATVGIYRAAAWAQRRLGWTALQPVATTTAVIVAALFALSLPTTVYVKRVELLSVLLGPSVVALGAGVERELPRLRGRAARVLSAVVAGAFVGVVSAVGVARLLGASPAIVATLAPKSTTTPIAMAIAERTGGLPPLAAAIVVLVGVVGAVVGPSLLRVAGVRDPFAWGLALGASSHGVGTARAVEEGETQAAASALGLALTGVVTSLVVPVVLGWL
ncbi:MAG: LrgB family protein [Polyangiaceae bacterium]|nr:LrgB family protein [Polyangiaceae bacterium]